MPRDREKLDAAGRSGVRPPKQTDRAARIAERGIEESARAAGALERIAGLLGRPTHLFEAEAV